MTKRSQSIDGFTLKRRDNTPTARKRISLDQISQPSTPVKRAQLQTTHQTAPTKRRVAKGEKRITPGASQVDLKTDVNESLQDLQDLQQPPRPSRREQRRATKSAKKTSKANGSKKKKWIKWSIIGVVVLILAVGGFMAWKVLSNLGKVFDGNPLNALTSNQRLKTDAYGRTNILIFGDESDSEVHADAGGELTDSIMVISVNQDTNDAALYSIPRDLWVKYPTSCSAGYEGKINAVYMCAMQNAGGDEKAGSDVLRKTVSEYFDQDIQYYAKANFTLVRDAVDAVGGISIVIESDDPRGILDRNFDWECNYQCYFVKYENGPTPVMDGVHALALSRARNAQGGYGLGGSNFDREVNQQKIAIAVKEKAVSAGVIANPLKVTQLLDAFGNNLTTNIEAGEVQSLAKLAQKIDTENIKQISFIDEDSPQVMTGSINGQSIVRPTLGTYDFSGIRAFLVKQLAKVSEREETAEVPENATIGVYNGSGVNGAAARLSDNLVAQGLDAAAIGNAPGIGGTYAIYDLSGGTKPNTSSQLADLYGVTVTAASAASLPSGVTADHDFVIIIGSNGAN